MAKYTAVDDIVLLKESNATKEDYGVVSSNCSKILKRAISRRGARDRVNLLLTQFRVEDKGNLGK